ncbi:MAG: transposase [Gammaproteobacteria bacterium]|nr:MAG: transposase [Gammaproteobacteria bacterium]
MSDNIKNGIPPSRKAVDMSPGSYVIYNEKTYRISEIIDLSGVVAIDVETGRSKPLPINQLEPADSLEIDGRNAIDIDGIGDEEWKIANHRFAAIKPLLEIPCLTRGEVEKRGEEVGVSANTLYRWMRDFNSLGTIAALIPKKRGWTTGASRISKAVEEIIDEVINDTYLTVQRSTAEKVVIEVKRRCLKKGITPPHANTIRSRVARISERVKLRGRGHREKAINKFQPAAGQFPGADYPLAVVQIDHTPLDIIVVDDIHRKPIGRPWLSLAMDIFSRVVTGYYLSFDAPSGTSVAMTVSHSILPKENWLALHEIDADWDVWGIMDKIHVDNGPDFRSDNFKRSCEMYGINLEFRPVKRPKFGGHIERLLGTFLKEIHDLPGTTFSSVKERDGYDSDKHACMTMAELEKWLVTFICKVYHQRRHSGIGMSPMKKWEIGIMGNAETPGRGVPPRPANGNTIFMDFLPAFHRTVQNYGVAIDGLRYYADVLRPWINANEPGTPGKKRKFIFRRDPRRIKTIWFFDPEIKQYFPIPFANQALPEMSVWEYRSACEQIKKAGNEVNEHEILKAISELREQVEQSSAKTRKARRAQQRRAEHKKNITPANPIPDKPPTSTVSSELPMADDLFDGEVEAFEDIG